MSEQRGNDQPSTMRSVRTWLLIALAVVLAIVFMQNLAPVRVDLLFWGFEMPLVVILVIVAALGFVIGWLAARLGRRKGDKKK